MDQQFGIAQERIEWMVNKDSILHPKVIEQEVPESSTTRNRRNAIKARHEKQSRSARRLRGEQVIGTIVFHPSPIPTLYCI